MSNTRENLQKIYGQLPPHVRLIAVSKFKPDAAVLEAYCCGQKIFGENRVQELVGKYQRLPKDIEWHFIGHLQTNKVGLIVPFVSLIHSIDSLRLLTAVDREARKVGRQVPCLLQFHIAKEATKFGFTFAEAVEMLQSPEYKELAAVKIVGVMGMATFSDDKALVRGEFKELKRIFEALKARFFADDSAFSELSMGMSDDYPEALAEGSTMIRVGSLIFGARN
ncbi:MAG: YggS family pyridoxal phosphate-dependent enzyme [Bacteroidales bacterium]|jgi:pyridoxal phosphate enzyme (YggS family)|nr:YggS family pyridoxal phosphate-dependent enzyme [Bacteroidales bacterium]